MLLLLSFLQKTRRKRKKNQFPRQMNVWVCISDIRSCNSSSYPQNVNIKLKYIWKAPSRSRDVEMKEKEKDVRSKNKSNWGDCWVRREAYNKKKLHNKNRKKNRTMNRLVKNHGTITELREKRDTIAICMCDGKITRKKKKKKLWKVPSSQQKSRKGEYLF